MLRKIIFNTFALMIMTHMLITPGIAQVLNEVHSLEEAPQSQSPYSVQITMGLPNKGFLDSFHNAMFVKDADKQIQMEYALYALRNLHVMKLIKTRKALKELIGSDERLKNIGLKNDIQKLTFDVPVTVKKLYQGETEILEVSEDISWLNGKNVDQKKSLESTFSHEERVKLITGLMALSIQLVNYDNLLKYVRKDMWVEAFPDRTARKFLREKYTTNYQLKALEVQLQGLRDGIIYRYHVLAQEEKDVPLYKSIYKLLEKNYGFPSSEMIQRQDDKQDVFINGKAFVLPATFENKVATKTKELFNSNRRETAFKDLNPIIEKGLVLALKNNSEALKALTGPVNFNDDENIFLFLALNEASWAETKSYYLYLNDYVNFDTGFVESYRQNYLKDLKRGTLKRVGIQAGVALALVSAVLSGGGTLLAGGAVAGSSSAAVAVSMSAIGSTAGLASGALILGQSASSYNEAREYSNYAENLFYGSMDISSLEEVKHYAQIEKSEFSSMILSLILIGAPTATLNVISKGHRTLIAGGKQLVMLKPETFLKLKNLIEVNKARFLQLGVLGKSLFSNSLNSLLKATGNVERVMQLEMMIGNAAKAAGVTMARAKDILAANAQAKKVMDWYISKTAANPLFLTQLVREIGIDLSIMFVAEYFVRGSTKFWDELPYILMNGLVWIVLTTVIVVKSTASSTQPKLMFDVLLDKRTGAFAKGVAMGVRGTAVKESLKIFYTSGKELAIAGSGAALAVYAPGEIIQHLKDPNKEEVSERFKRLLATAIFFGLYVGISSNLRSQAINGWMEPRLAVKMGKRALSKQGVMNPEAAEILAAAKVSKEHHSLMGLVSFGNNMFGNFSFSVIMKNLGLQTSDNESEEDFEEDMKNIYFRLNTNTNNSQYLFDFL